MFRQNYPLVHTGSHCHQNPIFSQGAAANGNPARSHIGSQGATESPGGSDVRGTQIAPCHPPSLPCTMCTWYHGTISPPLSRVTRLRRVQRWLAPSPINRSHTFVSKHSPTLCIQPDRASGVISYKPSFRTSSDLQKVTVIQNLDIPRI